MPHDFVALVGVTTAHVPFDTCGEPRPLVVLGHEGLGPRHAVVTGERAVVVLLQDL